MWRFTRLLLAAVLASVLVVAFAPQQAQAHPRHGGPFGLGIILGEPTAISGKVFFTNEQALDFHLGVDSPYRGGHRAVGIYADYLFHIDLGLNPAWASIPLYLGPGLGILFVDGRYCWKFGCYDDDDDIFINIRMPIGMTFLFSKFGGEAFAELVPNFFVFPGVDFDLDGAIGFRYYF